jgi:hypothetical protein
MDPFDARAVRAAYDTVAVDYTAVLNTSLRGSTCSLAGPDGDGLALDRPS